MTDIMDELKQADFILYSGKCDVRDIRNLDLILEKIRWNAETHFFQKDVLEFDNFKRHDYREFRAKYQKAINNFNLAGEIFKENDIGVDLYQKSLIARSRKVL